MVHVFRDSLQIRKVSAAFKWNDLRVRDRVGDGTEVRMPVREIAVAVDRQRGALNATNIILLTLKHALNHTCEAEAASGLQRLLRLRNERALVFTASG